MNLLLAVLNVLGLFDFVTVKYDIVANYSYLVDITNESYEAISSMLGLSDVELVIDSLDYGVNGNYNVHNNTVTISTSLMLCTIESSLEECIKEIRKTIAHELTHALQFKYRKNDACVSGMYSKRVSYEDSVIERHADDTAQYLMDELAAYFEASIDSNVIYGAFISISDIIKKFDKMFFMSPEFELKREISMAM